MSEDNLDYATGEPRRHHQYYIPSGDIVLQVQNAIFKVHRFFLAQYSSVLKDMLEVPQDGESKDGTDEKPLVLHDDTATGWELVFRAIYRTNPTVAVEYAVKEGSALLQVATKYCMDIFEGAAIAQLERASTTDEFIELLLASQLLSSKAMYKQALDKLARNWMGLTWEQAQKIGLKPYYEVSQRYRSLCHSCGLHNCSVVRCDNCGARR